MRSEQGFKIKQLTIKPSGETFIHEKFITEDQVLRETGDITDKNFMTLINRWNKQSMSKETNVNRYFYTY